MNEPDSMNPWDWLSPHDYERFGPWLGDEAARARWCFIIMTGGLPMLWRRLAKPAREVAFSKLELKPGAKVLLIGEALEECGFVEEIQSQIGETGEVVVVELIEQARNSVMSFKRGRGGQLGTWPYTYTHKDPDNTYDAIACLQGVQHTDDWRETAIEFTRVAKPGAMIVLGELTIGPTFKQAVKMDVHLEYYVEKLYQGAGMSGIELAYYSPQELRDAFSGLLENQETHEWRGAELFWGRKPRA